MDAFAVRIAGEMRLDAAIPLIITKVKEGGEEAVWLREQCEATLVKIGGDTPIHAVAEMYRQGDSHLRMAACNVLEHVHCDLAVTTALELLPNEEDGTIRAFLAGGLASHYAFEAIEPIRRMVIDGTYDDSFSDLKRDVVIAATLMGVEFPERKLWNVEVKNKQMELASKQLKERSQSLAQEIRRLKSKKRRLEQQHRRLVRQVHERNKQEAAPPPPKQTIGRNDPCPCGSGKKFKRCCLRKQGDGLLD